MYLIAGDSSQMFEKTAQKIKENQTKSKKSNDCEENWRQQQWLLPTHHQRLTTAERRTIWQRTERTEAAPEQAQAERKSPWQKSCRRAGMPQS
jgi:hypothetical protein